jgi:hypothetical protein
MRVAMVATADQAAELQLLSQAVLQRQAKVIMVALVLQHLITSEALVVAEVLVALVVVVVIALIQAVQVVLEVHPIHRGVAQHPLVNYLAEPITTQVVVEVEHSPLEPLLVVLVAEVTLALQQSQEPPTLAVVVVVQAKILAVIQTTLAQAAQALSLFGMPFDF